MKMTKIAVLILVIAAALYILIPSLSWAEDGTALYKVKCSAPIRCEHLQENLRHSHAGHSMPTICHCRYSGSPAAHRCL